VFDNFNQILTKLGFSRHIFVYAPSVQFHANTSSRSQVYTCKQRGRRTLRS